MLARAAFNSSMLAALPDMVTRSGRDNDTVLAVMALIVPFLMHELAVVLVGLIVTGISFMILFHARPAAGEPHQAFSATQYPDFQLQTVVGAVRISGLGFRDLHAHGSRPISRHFGTLQACQGIRHEGLDAIGSE